MVISASVRTDIPAFYGDWFMQRLDAGYCRVTQPFSGDTRVVSLRPGDVDAFVFWTKNLAPFEPHLREVNERGFPFNVQYTITGYPRELEVAVVDADRSIEAFRRTTERYGPDVCVWRYDTILHSSLTPPEWHVANFTRIAESLRGSTDEVVISFMQVYKKTERNLAASAREWGFTWTDPPDDEKRALASRLVKIAADNGMTLSVCAQPQYVVEGAQEARCIDGARLARIAGKPFAVPEHGNRPGCRCGKSVDIGEYDTCPHGCVYCYAVRNRRLAKARYAAHDPAGEFLFAREDSTERASEDVQLPLFRER